MEPIRTISEYCSTTWLILFVSLSAIFVAQTQGQDFVELKPDAIPKSDIYTYENAGSKDCEKGKTLTKLHQEWLFYNYRGLWEYRRSFHPYDKFLFTEDSQWKDSKENHGSVVFLNWQDNLLRLNCPCAEGSKEVKWTLYGKGSGEFHTNAAAGNRPTLNIPTPHQRYYYRTFSCKVGENTHFFNIFTRPLAITEGPPLMFTEGISGPADKKMEITCGLTMYQHEIKSKHAYLAVPYEFYWQIPPIDKNIEYTETQDRAARPAADDGENMFWDAHNPPYGLGFSAHQPPSSRELEIKNHDPAKPEVCDSPPATHNPREVTKILLGTSMKIKSDYALPIHAGVYSCIVIDANGLSSSFWWDGDRPPKDPFRGNSRVRVRGMYYTVLSIVFLLGLCALIPLFICILPDNKEDFQSEKETADSTLVTVDGDAPAKTEGTEPTPTASDASKLQDKNPANAAGSDGKPNMEPAKPAPPLPPPKAEPPKNLASSNSTPRLNNATSASKLKTSSGPKINASPSGKN